MVESVVVAVVALAHGGGVATVGALFVVQFRSG